MEDSISR